VKIVWKHYRVIDRSYSVELMALASYHGGSHFILRDGTKCAHYTRHVTKWTPKNHGGATFCYLYDDDGILLSTGIAKCSVLDQFCYETGRRISKGRALDNLASESKLGFYSFVDNDKMTEIAKMLHKGGLGR